MPPLPGTPVRRAIGAERDEALFFDGMERRPAGRPVARRRTAVPEPRLPRRHARRPREHQRHLRRRHQDELRDVPALLPLRVRRARGRRPSTPKALVFNVKGEDLLWLDRPNIRLDDRQAARYGRVGLPVERLPERRLLRPSPPRRAERRRRTWPAATPASPRSSGRWNSFCQDELLPFLFADAEDDRQQYTMVIHNVTARLREATAAGDGAVSIEGEVVRSFRDLVELVQARLDGRGRPAGPALGRPGHRRRHRQRLHPPPLRRRAPRPAPPAGRRGRAGAPPRRARAAGDGGRPPQPERPGEALRGRRRAPQGLRGQGAGRPGPPAAARGAGRAQQVRPAGRLQPDQGDPVRRGRAGPVPGHDPDRRPADGQRGRAPHRGELGHPGGGPPRRRRGGTRRVRLPARRATRPGQDPQAGDDAGRPARAARPPRRRVPLPGLGHQGQRGGRGDGRRAASEGGEPPPDPFAGLP